MQLCSLITFYYASYSVLMLHHSVLSGRKHLKKVYSSHNFFSFVEKTDNILVISSDGRHERTGKYTTLLCCVRILYTWFSRRTFSRILHRTWTSLFPNNFWNLNISVNPLCFVFFLILQSRVPRLIIFLIDFESFFIF